jgi:outer membrane protein
MNRIPPGPGARTTLWVALALCSPSTATAQTLTLVEAIDSASSSHPAIAAADARVSAAGDAGDAARAAWLPGAAISGTLTRFQEPMVVAPFHSLNLTNPPEFDRTLVQGRLAMDYTLFDGGARSARIAAADALEEGTESGRDATRMRVLEETTSAYVGLRTARAVLDAATAQVQALDEERSRAQQQLDVGSAARVEVLRASATLQEARAEEASARSRVTLAERTLARLMNVDPASLAGRELADVAPGPTSIRGDASSSPAVAQADRSVTAAQARLSEQKAGRLPSVQAAAGVLDFGTLDNSHTVEWQAGLQVSWPIFTGGARSASVRRARADVAAARSDLAAAQLQVDQAIDQSSTAVVEADAKAEALASAVSQWEEVARIEALALGTGSGVQADLLRAQAGLYQARAGYARARSDAVLARVQLARAEGVLDRRWINESLETR